MNEYEFACLCTYVRAMADEVGLRDWTFTIMREPAKGDDLGAEITVTYGRRHANVSVCRDWNSLPDHERRHIVVHELLHCFTNAPHMRTEVMLEDLVGAAVWPVVEASLRMDMEHVTDAIASALAKHLPLPEWIVGDDMPIGEPWVGPVERAT